MNEHQDVELSEREPSNVRGLFEQLLENEPKVIYDFVPADGVKQKNKFLQGEVRNPDHRYERLAIVDFAKLRENITVIGNQILEHDALPLKQRNIYEIFIDSYLKKLSLMEVAHKINMSVDSDERASLEAVFMEINSELYGVPDEHTYRGLLGQKLQTIRSKELHESDESIRSVLFAIAPKTEDMGSVYRPNQETVTWLKEMLEGDEDTLYGKMIMHVPDEDPDRKFTASEMKTVFEAVISEEFGDAAKGWRVDIEPAQSINVKASEKRIVIPESRQPVGVEQLKGLIVHEIGVHMLRSVTGGETDVAPLAIGVEGYYDPEEGLGRAVEQALKGIYEPAGVNYYIIAGAMYYDKLDFRDVHELMWRVAALQKATPDKGLDDEVVDKIRSSTYGSILRLTRGTDTQPWFKDLAYYNGNTEAWQYIERTMHDPEAFLQLFTMGKTDPEDPLHIRAMLESHSLH